MSQPQNNSQVLANHPSQQGRITRRQSKENGNVIVPPLSFPKRQKPPPEPLPDRFQCLSKSNLENFNCPRHHLPVTLVCTDIACNYNRLGCLDCLLCIHRNHIVISLDRFMEIIPKLQVKESERQFLTFMNEIRHSIIDCREILDSEVNSRNSCREFFGSSFERIDLTLRLLEYQTRINQSDVLSLKTNKISQYAATHWLFSQTNTPLYDCIEFFARIAYHPRVQVLTEQILGDYELTENMKRFDRERNILQPKIEQPVKSQQNNQQKSLFSKDSQFIFSSKEDTCSQSDRINKQLWKVTEKKIVVVKQAKEEKITETQQKKQTIDQNQGKGKKGIWKRVFQDEIKVGETDQMLFQDGESRKRRKLNDTTKDNNNINKIGLESQDVSKQQMKIGKGLERKEKKGRRSSTKEIDEKLKQKQEMENSQNNSVEDKQNNLNSIGVTEKTWQARTRSGTRREELIQLEKKEEEKKMLQRGRNRNNKKDLNKQGDQLVEKQKTNRRNIKKNSRKEQIADKEEAQEKVDDDPTVIGEQEESEDSLDLEMEENNNQEKISQNNDNNDDPSNYQIIPNNDESFSYETVSSSLGFLEEVEPVYQDANHLTVSEISRDGRTQKPNHDVSFELSGYEDNDDVQPFLQNNSSNSASNKSNPLSKWKAKNNPVSNSTSSRTQTMAKIAITAQMSEQQFKQMKQQAFSESAKHHQLLNLLNYEFDRQQQLQQLSSLNNPSQLNIQQQSKVMLKYRHIGGRTTRLSTRIRDFEELLQEGEDQIIISYSSILQEISNLLNWVGFQLKLLISNYCPKYSYIQAYSRCIAHYTDQNIRKKIISMSFIRCQDTNKKAFLTVDQQSEMKIWEINSSNDIRIISKYQLDQQKPTPKLFISRGERSFLIGGELYNDEGCSLFRVSSSTNSCSLLSHYKIRCGNADVPFVGLIVQGKMVVVQKKNQYTKIGLFVPASSKFVRHYQFYYEFDHVELAHNSKNLLGMACSEYSRFGVLDLVTGKSIFTTLFNVPLGEFIIEKAYPFLDGEGAINFAVSMRKKTGDNARQQQQRVAGQVESAGVAKTKEQFRFEIYQILDFFQSKGPFWERLYVRADEVQVIQVQYSSSLDQLIFLEGSSSFKTRYDVLKFDDYEEEEEQQNQGKKQQQSQFNCYSLVLFDIKKRLRTHLFTQTSEIQGFILNDETNQIVLSLRNSTLRLYQLKVASLQRR